MHECKGHSSLHPWSRPPEHRTYPSARPRIQRYRQCLAQSHGLHTIPGPVASNNAACPRWKNENQDCGSTTGPRWPTTRASSRLPPSSPPPSYYNGVPEPLASRHIHPPWKCHHGSAIFIVSAFVARVYCLNKLSCPPQSAAF
ncbi:unnamed protein product [Penicillium nalgiovense]|nr:unnamed protein product [Penicillium nalgiovense]CAG8132527.1 unnamed protein product [Penicillium nalgiovense]CAG8152554.1 unnamed protein product [Penicillium nalgiovense]CAG8160430.1 unnamed protein product [Penicillium nalgiovense]CAG8183199.1 unnamed protein product [Penicillium nalgiovense]